MHINFSDYYKYNYSPPIENAILILGFFDALCEQNYHHFKFLFASRVILNDVKIY